MHLHIYIYIYVYNSVERVRSGHAACFACFACACGGYACVLRFRRRAAAAAAKEECIINIELMCACRAPRESESSRTRARTGEPSYFIVFHHTKPRARDTYSHTHTQTYSLLYMRVCPHQKCISPHTTPREYAKNGKTLRGVRSIEMCGVFMLCLCPHHTAPPPYKPPTHPASSSIHASSSLASSARVLHSSHYKYMSPLASTSAAAAAVSTVSSVVALSRTTTTPVALPPQPFATLL